MKRQMKLGMSMRGLGYHTAAWRHPDVPADGTVRFEHYVRNAQAAERGLFDMIFFADASASARRTSLRVRSPAPATRSSRWSR